MLLADPAPEVRAEAIARLVELEATAKPTNPTAWLALTRKDVPQVRLQALLASRTDDDYGDLLKSLAEKDAFLRSAAEIALGQRGGKSAGHPDDLLLAARMAAGPDCRAYGRPGRQKRQRPCPCFSPIPTLPSGKRRSSGWPRII